MNEATRSKDLNWTQNDVRTVTDLCKQFGWLTDINEQDNEAQIGPFYATKHETDWLPCNGRPGVKFVLYETITSHSYPAGPDYDESVEFDTISGSVLAMMQLLWLREREYEIQNIMEDYYWSRAGAEEEEQV
jgi:hypothetical protein